MIQVKDLRIGNWVFIPGLEYYVIVIAIFKTHFRCESKGGISHDESIRINYQPIPLTPSILEKCGWIWNEECNSFEKYPNSDARMNLQFRELKSSYTMFNYVLKAKISDKIYYLHQLQNLTFALTGEELQVNL